MYIEMLAEQIKNFDQFHSDVIIAYEYLCNKFQIEDKPYQKLVNNFHDWHPEKYGDLNDSWEIIELLNLFCYWQISYDYVTYDVHAWRDEKDVNFDIVGDGLNISQAICNCLINISNYLQSNEYRFKHWLKDDQTN